MQFLVIYVLSSQKHERKYALCKANQPTVIVHRPTIDFTKKFKRTGGVKQCNNEKINKIQT